MKMENKILQKSSLSHPEEINGILFKDVKEIVKSKEDLEGIILSTKVIFKSKSEMLEFFELLVKYGYKDSALNYIEEMISGAQDYELIDGFNSLLQ